MPFRRKRQIKDSLSRGDRARDRRDWAEARVSYQAAVAADPSLVHIWVQLGHARKEGGDREGGLEAYLRAWDIKKLPDTALQIGHVQKLLGRRDEAVSWYKTAANMASGLSDPLVELLGLGLDQHDIAGAIKMAPDEAAYRFSPKLLLLDVTASLDRAGVPILASRQACWTLDLAAGLASQGFAVQMVALGPGDIGFQAVSTGSGPQARPDASGTPWAVSDLPRLPSQTVILLLPTDRFLQQIIATNTLRLQHGVLPIAVIRDASPLVRPERFAGSSAHDQLVGLLGAAHPGFSLAMQRGIDVIQSYGISRLPLAPPSGKVQRRSPRNDPEPNIAEPAGDDVLLASRDPAELRLSLQAWQKASARRLVLVTTGEPSSESSASNIAVACGVDLAQLDIIPPDPGTVRSRIASARILVAPSGREDAELWISDAIGSGTPVIAAATPRLTDCGAGIVRLVDFEAGALVSAWSKPREWIPSQGKFTPWLAVMADTLRGEIQVEPKQLQSALIVNGRFYSLQREQDRLFATTQFLLGQGWKPSNDGFAVAAGEIAHMKMRVLSFADQTFVCKVLAHRADPTNSSDKPTNWFWTMSSFHVEMGISEITVALDGLETTDVSGFIVYPEDEGHHWPRFADQVGRGVVSAIPRSIAAIRPDRPPSASLGLKVVTAYDPR